jgi:hypothetical protein
MKNIRQFLGVVLVFFSSVSYSQIIQSELNGKNNLGLKTGWDQTLAIGVNYSYNLDSSLFNKRSNLQIEFLSPMATFHQFNNGRTSIGFQSELYRKSKFKLYANLFATYSWTEDVLTKIKGLGIFTSICPAYYSENGWLLGAEIAYRPTLLAYYDFSETADETFNDRYPNTRGSDEVPSRDGWYSFTNNRFQLSIIINKNLSQKMQLGLKLGFENFANENDILLNGWIGQIPLNGNINFGYNF